MVLGLLKGLSTLQATGQVTNRQSGPGLQISERPSWSQGEKDSREIPRMELVWGGRARWVLGEGVHVSVRKTLTVKM